MGLLRTHNAPIGCTAVHIYLAMKPRFLSNCKVLGKFCVYFHIGFCFIPSGVLLGFHTPPYLFDSEVIYIIVSILSPMSDKTRYVSSSMSGNELCFFFFCIFIRGWYWFFFIYSSLGCKFLLKFLFTYYNEIRYCSFLF